MPRFTTVGGLDAARLSARLVACDGHDGARPEAAGAEGERVWIVLAGRFAWRSRRRRAVADPAMALVIAGDEPYEIRHPGGGDVCLSLGGDAASAVCAALPPGGAPLSEESFLAFRALATRLRRGAPVDPLALEEALAGLCGSPGSRPPAPDRRARDIAEAIRHELARRVDETVPLAELAAAAGVSLFHACRVFRAVVGTSIHQHRRALRLRHALAYLLDGSWPLARVAAECGYASQAHMTNHLRAARGVTPKQLRSG